MVKSLLPWTIFPKNEYCESYNESQIFENFLQRSHLLKTVYIIITQCWTNFYWICTHGILRVVQQWNTSVGLDDFCLMNFSWLAGTAEPPAEGVDGRVRVQMARHDHVAAGSDSVRFSVGNIVASWRICWFDAQFWC